MQDTPYKEISIKEKFKEKIVVINQSVENFFYFSKPMEAYYEKRSFICG